MCFILRTVTSMDTLGEAWTEWQGSCTYQQGLRQKQAEPQESIGRQVYMHIESPNTIFVRQHTLIIPKAPCFYVLLFLFSILFLVLISGNYNYCRVQLSTLNPWGRHLEVYSESLDQLWISPIHWELRVRNRRSRANSSRTTANAFPWFPFPKCHIQEQA